MAASSSNIPASSSLEGHRPNGVVVSRIRQCLPRQGMRYQSPVLLTSRSVVDTNIFNALMNFGFMSQDHITRHIRGILGTSAEGFQRVNASRSTGNELSLWDALERIRRIVGWADDVPLAEFFEFVTAIIVAESSAGPEDNMNPEEPPNTPQQQDLLDEIRAFRDAVGDQDQWIRAEVERYNFAPNGALEGLDSDTDQLSAVADDGHGSDGADGGGGQSVEDDEQVYDHHV